MFISECRDSRSPMARVKLQREQSPLKARRHNGRLIKLKCKINSRTRIAPANAASSVAKYALRQAAHKERTLAKR